MKNKVRVVFNRRKQASESNCAAVEIVVCFGRERFYFSTGIFLNLTQWEDGSSKKSGRFHTIYLAYKI